MERYLLMDRLALGKLIPWKVVKDAMIKLGI